MRSIVRVNGAQTAQGTEIHWVPAGRAAPETITGVASIHAAWNGSYSISVDGHAPLKLEDEVFVALNAGHVLSTRGRRDPGACLLSVYFAPQLLAEAVEALAPVDRELLLAYSQDKAFRLFEHVRESDRSLASVMRYIAHHVSAGIEDPQWCEEQVSFLLRRLLAQEASLARTVDGMTHMKSWKRRETFLRLSRVTDLIHSCYECPLTIEELAEAAHWSRFHMMREFKAVHGISPYEYLQRRRTQAAARLLCSTDLAVAEIAERTGFHVRTLVRRLRRSRGLGARALRMLAHETTQSQQSASYRMATGVV
ncbi:MAG TPA: AraC family transcriptional regulator [Steroidobacteraceae bacterium]|jgi:AraC family transcriptional regulator|nr:AraC family transcriptional regulator [Steroidobacteraceae bacterium]